MFAPTYGITDFFCIPHIVGAHSVRPCFSYFATALYIYAVTVFGVAVILDNIVKKM